MVAVGDIVHVKVLQADGQRGRISLSRKQALSSHPGLSAYGVRTLPSVKALDNRNSSWAKCRSFGRIMVRSMRFPLMTPVGPPSRRGM